MSGSDPVPRDRSRRRGPRRIPGRFAGPAYTIWGAAWITAFATGHPGIGLPMMFATAVIPAVMESPGRRRRAVAPPDPVLGSPAPIDVPPAVPAPDVPSPERRLAASVVRAESSDLDPDALALVREVADLLRPLLATLRHRDADPGVRHDVEAVATDHLPAAIDAYLALPADYARTHRGPDGTTPADELRSQLTLLVEGCAQLRDAVRAADVTRQQQLGRFLDAKFGRSDLDL